VPAATCRERESRARRERFQGEAGRGESRPSLRSVRLRSGRCRRESFGGEGPGRVRPVSRRLLPSVLDRQGTYRPSVNGVPWRAHDVLQRCLKCGVQEEGNPSHPRGPSTSPREVRISECWTGWEGVWGTRQGLRRGLGREQHALPAQEIPRDGVQRRLDPRAVRRQPTHDRNSWNEVRERCRAMQRPLPGQEVWQWPLHRDAIGMDSHQWWRTPALRQHFRARNADRAAESVLTQERSGPREGGCAPYPNRKGGGSGVNRGTGQDLARREVHRSGGSSPTSVSYLPGAAPRARASGIESPDLEVQCSGEQDPQQVRNQ